MDIAFIDIILQLIFLEGILLIDNAAILEAMVNPLPVDEAIPWPKRLTRIGHVLNRLPGPQNRKNIYL